MTGPTEQAWMAPVRQVAGLALVAAALLASALQAGEADAYQRGLEQRKLGRQRAAQEQFRVALGLRPDDYRAALQVAEHCLAGGHWRPAAYWAEQALRYNPGWRKAHLLFAAALEAGGERRKAATELEACLAGAPPASADSLRLRIEALRGREESASASAKAAPQARRTVSKNVRIDTLFRRAVSEYEKRDYQQSLRTIRSVLQLQPDHAGAYYYGGLIRRRWGENDLAKINFGRALEYPEMGYNAHFYLAKMYQEEGNCSQALPHLEAYLAATSLETGVREAQRMMERCGRPVVSRAAAARADSGGSASEDSALMWVTPAGLEELLAPQGLDTSGKGAAAAGARLLARGSWAAAADSLERACEGVRADSSWTSARFDAALCNLRLGRFSRAALQLREAAGAPGSRLFGRSRVLEALALIHAGEPRKAESRLDDLLLAEPRMAWAAAAWRLLGESRMAQGKAQKAAEALERGLVDSSDAAETALCRYRLGEALNASGQPERAIEVWGALARAGEREAALMRVADASYRIGDERAREGRAAEALEWYGRALQRCPGHLETAWGLYQTAALKRVLGDYQGALAACARLARDCGDDYWAAEAGACVQEVEWSRAGSRPSGATGE